MASFRHEGNTNSQFMPFMRFCNDFITAHQRQNTVQGYTARVCSASRSSSLDTTVTLCQARSGVRNRA